MFEVIMTENFSKFMSDSKLQIQEAQRTPNRKNAKQDYTQAYNIKLHKIKDKEKILKEAEAGMGVVENTLPIEEQR